MKRLTFVLLFIGGCAPTRYSLREIHDYDEGIKTAEANGIETRAMHDHLVDMILSYAKDPAPDPLIKAAQDSANAQAMQAYTGLMNSVKPEPYVPPMSPAEYRRASSR